MIRRAKIMLIIAVAVSGCKHPQFGHHGEQVTTSSTPSPAETSPATGDSAPPSQDAASGAPAARIYREDERRLLYAQIVEDYDPDSYEESAILEGAPYKHFLKQCANTDQDTLRKQTNEQINFENVNAQPGLYRGQVVTIQRGVVLEATKVELPPEYGLPGYSVMLGVYVDAARDIWALRVVLPPGSKVYDKVRKGIDNDALPVCRACGYFMKLYARKTAVLNEPPWRRPLLICPELEFSKIADPRHVRDDLVESGADKLLPSQRMDATDAEERLVVEVIGDKSGGYKILAGGKTAGDDVNAFISEAVATIKSRLPADQAVQPAAVVLVDGSAPKAATDAALSALRAAGVQRLAIKRETGVSVSAK